MSKRRASSPVLDLIKSNLFLFYEDVDGTKMVDVDIKGDLWRNKYAEDKTLHEMLDWLLNGFSGRTQLCYYLANQTHGVAEYVFFANVGRQSGMHGVPVEVFWKRAATCFENQFSISASTRMSIGQALGVFEYLNLPAFESRCLQVTQFTAADVATLELHKLRTQRPFESSPSGRTVSDRFASILSRHLHSGEESSDGRGQGSSRLSMEEAIAAGPDARMSISREHKDAILAERSPAYMFNKYANARMLASDTLKPSFETTMARYKAEHATANEYTPEQQKEIRLARLMVPSFGLRHLEEHKLPPHLL